MASTIAEGCSTFRKMNENGNDTKTVFHSYYQVGQPEEQGETWNELLINALMADEELTPLGVHLAKMPVDPHSGKMLLFAALFSCLDFILTIAASLSFKGAFYVPMGHEETADERKLLLSNKSKSEHMLLTNAYRGWEEAVSKNIGINYCQENFLCW